MTTTEIQKPFEVLVSFLTPVEGNVTVAATSEEQAKELALELFKEKQDLKIIQIFDSNEVFAEQHKMLAVMQDEGLVPNDGPDNEEASVN